MKLKLPKPWIVSLLVGGSIGIILYALIGLGLELATLNAVVWTTVTRMLISAPDLLESPPNGSFDTQSGYGAALLAFLLVAVPAVVQSGETSPIGLAILVLGIGIEMWTFGVLFERSREHNND